MRVSDNAETFANGRRKPRIMNDLTRRDFLGLASIAGIGAIAAPANTADTPVAPAAKPTPLPQPVPDEFSTQIPALAREMVAVSHGNLDRVKELLSLHPTLANAGSFPRSPLRPDET